MAFTFRAPQVNFYVQDIEASVSFYRDLFGFTETFRTPQRGTPVHVELGLDGFTLGLATIETLRDTHGVTGGAGRPEPRSRCGPTTSMQRSLISAPTASSCSARRMTSPPRSVQAGSPTLRAIRCRS
jgi:hypothetical protein